MIGARLLFITWLTKNTFSKRAQFLLLHSLFTIQKDYLLPPKRKVSYMSGKLSMSVLYWIFSNNLHSYCIHCKRRGMQHCHVFLNCCHVEKMTLPVLAKKRTMELCFIRSYIYGSKFEMMVYFCSTVCLHHCDFFRRHRRVILWVMCKM